MKDNEKTKEAEQAAAEEATEAKQNSAETGDGTEEQNETPAPDAAQLKTELDAAKTRAATRVDLGE
ncbi:MAG: hypothetical protein ACI3XM_02815, partial [Eubacteriales bacterium]